MRLENRFHYATTSQTVCESCNKYHITDDNYLETRMSKENSYFSFLEHPIKQSLKNNCDVQSRVARASIKLRFVLLNFINFQVMSV